MEAITALSRSALTSLGFFWKAGWAFVTRFAFDYTFCLNLVMAALEAVLAWLKCARVNGSTLSTHSFASLSSQLGRPLPKARTAAPTLN